MSKATCSRYGASGPLVYIGITGSYRFDAVAAVDTFVDARAEAVGSARSSQRAAGRRARRSAHATCRERVERRSGEVKRSRRLYISDRDQGMVASPADFKDAVLVWGDAAAGSLSHLSAITTGSGPTRRQLRNRVSWSNCYRSTRFATASMAHIRPSTRSRHQRHCAAYISSTVGDLDAQKQQVIERLRGSMGSGVSDGTT